MSAATAAAIIGAAAAAKGAYDADKNAQQGLEQQKAQNTRNEQFIREQSALARQDTLPLFGQAQQNRLTGQQAALDILNQSLPQQAALQQQGNVGAQQALLAGLPQFQNALLGAPVDMSALQPQRLQFDAGFLPQKLPRFQTQMPETPTQQILAALTGGQQVGAGQTAPAPTGGRGGFGAEARGNRPEEVAGNLDTVVGAIRGAVQLTPYGQLLEAILAGRATEIPETHTVVDQGLPQHVADLSNRGSGGPNSRGGVTGSSTGGSAGQAAQARDRDRDRDGGQSGGRSGGRNDPNGARGANSR